MPRCNKTKDTILLWHTRYWRGWYECQLGCKTPYKPTSPSFFHTWHEFEVISFPLSSDSLLSINIRKPLPSFVSFINLQWLSPRQCPSPSNLVLFFSNRGRNPTFTPSAISAVNRQAHLLTVGENYHHSANRQTSQMPSPMPPIAEVRIRPGSPSTRTGSGGHSVRKNISKQGNEQLLYWSL